MFSKQVRIAAFVALAAAVSLVSSKAALAGTAKSYSYIGWIETQSVIYMVNQAYDTENDRWELAYDANIAAQYAFLELNDVSNNVRGSSLLQARDYLDEASENLFLLSNYSLPQNIRDKVESAQRYISLARNMVQKQLAASNK